MERSTLGGREAGGFCSGTEEAGGLTRAVTETVPVPWRGQPKVGGSANVGFYSTVASPLVVCVAEEPIQTIHSSGRPMPKSIYDSAPRVHVSHI